jgi:ATP-dependent RNA helicase RhlE
LVATDIAARWIDINELSHVFIYDIPTEPETYVHRIGRTGRAGAKWVAIAFCDSDEKKYLKEIIKVIKQDIPVIENHPFSGHSKKVK